MPRRSRARGEGGGAGGAGRRRVQRLVLALALGGGLAAAAARSATCVVPSASYASVARALADTNCTTVDLGTGIFPGLLLVPRTLTLVGDGVVQTILAGPVIASGVGTVVTLEQLRVDGTQPSSSGCPGPSLLTEGGGRAEAPQPTVVTDTATVTGSCTLFADGFESGNLKGWTLP